MWHSRILSYDNHGTATIAKFSKSCRNICAKLCLWHIWSKRCKCRLVGFYGDIVRLLHQCNFSLALIHPTSCRYRCGIYNLKARCSLFYAIGDKKSNTFFHANPFVFDTPIFYDTRNQCIRTFVFFPATYLISKNRVD